MGMSKLTGDTGESCGAVAAPKSERQETDMVNRLLVNFRLLEFRENARRLGDNGNEWSVRKRSRQLVELGCLPGRFFGIDGNSVAPDENHRVSFQARFVVLRSRIRT